MEALETNSLKISLFTILKGLLKLFFGSFNPDR